MYFNKLDNNTETAAPKLCEVNIIFNGFALLIFWLWLSCIYFNKCFITKNLRELYWFKKPEWTFIFLYFDAFLYINMSANFFFDTYKSDNTSLLEDVPLTENIKVLSLFDWMSCWQIALNKLWITDYEYYASEIDKYAIQVAKDNFPSEYVSADNTDFSTNLL
jgi:DNA (cytosine-5)-methyltransferase 3A